MKHIFTLSFFTIVSLISTAQTANLVVFTEMGEKFTIYLNGEIQNESPKSNVKVNGLTGQFYQARIDFEDAALADFANNNVAVQAGVEATYLIKKNKKGEYVMRFNSEAPISGSTVSSQDSEQVSDAKRISVVDKTSDQNTAVETDFSDDVHHTGTTTTTTTTTQKGGTTGENVSLNMNVDGVSMGVNVNVNGENMGVGTNVNVKESNSTTVTSTTTTKTTGSNVSTTHHDDTPDVVVVSPCSSAMSKSAFESAKTSISGKGFDETKLSTAKQIAKSNCLLSSQIKEVMDLFGFEETKLDFAKYAYDYCMDTNNYYMVSDAFGFSSSTEELNEYIDSKN